MTQHRPRSIRRGAYLAIPAVGALFLAGCSGTSDAGQTGGTTEFSLTYATSNTIESPFEVLANEYMAANPDVTINLEPQPNDKYGDTIRTQLQAGNAPDVIETEGGSGQTRSVIPLAEAGFLEPLGESAQSTIPSGSDALFTYEDELYAQPLGISYAGIVYNKTAGDAAGVTEFPTDWDSVVDACTTATGAGKSLFVLAGAAPPNTGITAMIISATRVYAENPDWNQDRAAGDVTFADTKGWQETLQTILDLKDAGCFQAGVEGGGFDAITNGMTSGSSSGFFGPLGSASELQKAAPDQEFVAQAFPPKESDGAAFGVASPTYSLSINAASEKKEAAQDFLDWLAEPEQATLFADASGGLPSTGLDTFDFSDTIYADVADPLANGDYTALPNSAWANPAVYEALSTGVQGLLTGQTTVDGVLESMDTAWGQ